MTRTDLISRDATAIAELARAGTVSVVEIAQAFLDRVAARDDAVGAWSFLDPEQVIEQARALDRRSERGRLHGVPVGVKDVFQTRDMPTGHGSPIYADHRPGVDATSVDLLRSAGALILGKTTTVEFAGFGRKADTRHPLDPERSPGGTSSGSAAAVCDRQTPLALGTQTAGSTIRPASFCGVHAFKPTFGAVGREGVKFFSPSLDTVTWFGRSVRDLALPFAVYGLDALPAKADLGLDTIVVAICRTPFWAAAQPAVQAGLDAAAGRLAAAGVRVVELELPAAFAELRALQTTIMLAEGRISLLNEFARQPQDLHPDHIRMISGDRVVSSAAMLAALDRAAALRPIFDALASDFDAILTPSAADEAPLGRDNTGDASFNQLWSALHVPCVNLPVLLGPAGLPIGLTVTGPRFADRQVLQSAQLIEAALATPATATEG